MKWLDNPITWRKYLKVAGIVGTITAIDTFLGVILGISSAKYNKTL